MSDASLTGTALQRLARACGIVPEFFDATGTWRRASADTLEKLLAALGEPVSGEEAAEKRLAERADPANQPRLAPTLTVRGSRSLQVPLALPEAEAQTRIAWRLETETGEELTGEASWHELPEQSGGEPGGSTSARRLSLEGPIPQGYHRLHLDAGGERHSAHVIAAPETCYPPDALSRHWGLGAQLYSLRSEPNWGLGDYADLAELAEATARRGGDFLGISPVHALFSADPDRFGPYGPSNRLFYNVAHIDPTAIDGFDSCDEAQRIAAENQTAIEAARESELVEYAAVDRIKRPVLEALWRYFRDNLAHEAPGERFAAFKARGGEALHRHGVFEALHARFVEHGQDDWRAWPEAYRDPASEAVAAFAREQAERVEFFCWLQWIAEEQLATVQSQARDYGMKLGLYSDMAVGLHPGGSAAWSHQQLIPAQVAVGAPPDDFNHLGQNWGLAPLSPKRLIERGCDVFASDLAAAMRHAGAMRLDHAMQLERLYWIPEGAGATDGAYLEYPMEAMLAATALESWRNECLVIGEDLGTVPEGFRERLAGERILSYKVFYFERDGEGGFTPPSAYPADALVAPTTHDLPTLRGLLHGRDLDWREHLALFADGESRDAARAERDSALYRLIAALREAEVLSKDLPEPEEVVAALHAYLAGAPSRLMIVQAEDLVAAVEQPNLPGTTDEHPNWRRKLPVPVEELLETAMARRILEAVRARRGKL